MDRKSLIADQVYDGLKKSLLVSGKGRRPDLPLELQSGKVTQKLLVQLYYLREEGSKPWSEVEDWLVKIFPAALPHRRRVRHLTESAITNFLKATDVDLFLAQDVDFDYISDSLSKYKITRATFASPPSSACDHKIDNKTVVDIDLARKDLNYPKALTLKWIYHLTGHSPTIKAIDKILTVYAKVQNLSGGELQRVALTLCLGKPADIYLIDEPSAYLDSEQRLHAAKVIKRFILHAKKTAFIVEHDFIMATYLADRVVVFEGTPSINTMANSPQSLLNGMNSFLESLDITFRRDPNNFRPRINKLNSVKDTEQKKSGNFFFLED
ncbi:ATP-binding cassette sub-family e member 1 [Plakobranchus ocellatus]|uniref:ATP-binding cassette sub-family e member 1 n=1 Tax=Plakobranchus ocellatus TaxID=259542 RepID=A0AAV4BHR6_9GAST|nr:ATP-binding cassette sub-family e member 1 [Plakobranchus ocellatus]